MGPYSNHTKALAKSLSILSLCTHFFCCFLPGVVSVLTLVTVTGAATITMEDFGIPESVHEQMIYISALVLVISGFLNYLSWKIDCREVGCVHEPCAPRKSKYFKLYMISVVFFLLNAVIHFTLHVPHEHVH